MTMQTPSLKAVLAYLTQAAESPLRDVGIAGTSILSGDRNALWRVQAADQDIVLKMFLDAGQARGRRQYNNQESAARIGAAPAPIAFDRYPAGLSHQVMLYHWQDGIQFDPRKTEHHTALAEALVRIHTRVPAGHERLSPHPINQAYLWSLMQGSRMRIAAWLQDRPADDLTWLMQFVLAEADRQIPPRVDNGALARPALVHGDLFAEHCLLHGTQFHFVDWEMGGLGDPAREVAHLLVHMLRSLDQPARDLWLAQYLEGMDEATLAARIATYEMMLPIESFMELLLPLTQPAFHPGPDNTGAHTLLHLAFRECLQDVDRVLALALEAEERQRLGDLYQARLKSQATVHAGV